MNKKHQKNYIHCKGIHCMTHTMTLLQVQFPYDHKKLTVTIKKMMMIILISVLVIVPLIMTV